MPWITLHPVKASAVDGDDCPLDVDEVVFRQILSYPASISGCQALQASFMPRCESECFYCIFDLFSEPLVVIPL